MCEAGTQGYIWDQLLGEKAVIQPLPLWGQGILYAVPCQAQLGTRLVLWKTGNSHTKSKSKGSANCLSQSYRSSYINTVTSWLKGIIWMIYDMPILTF